MGSRITPCLSHQQVFKENRQLALWSRQHRITSINLLEYLKPIQHSRVASHYAVELSGGRTECNNHLSKVFGLTSAYPTIHQYQARYNKTPAISELEEVLAMQHQLALLNSNLKTPFTDLDICGTYENIHACVYP